MQIHAAPVFARIQENIPGFMYWFRARGYGTFPLLKKVNRRQIGKVDGKKGCRSITSPHRIRTTM